MVNDFWFETTTSLSMLLLVFFAVLYLIINRQKIFGDSDIRFRVLLGAIPVFLIVAYFGNIFVNCCMDYKYVRNDTYIEAEAEVIRYTYVKLANWEHTGDYVIEDPLFYIAETDEYIILDVKNVKVGKTYLIRFYPNTGICEIVEEIT